jgi:sialic acid synthase SpsE
MNFYEKLTNPENPFIIAEIGSNHNGDLSKAKQMIDVAVEAGCDAVKFQSWDYDSLFSQSILDQHTDMVAEGVDAKGLEEIQKKLALSKEAHFELKQYADEKNILFFSYPLSEKHVDWLVELDVPFIKVGSLDIVNLPLLKKIAKQGKPIILSTGMATLSEVEQALETIYNEGNRKVVLLHCVAVYPPQCEENNLRNILMLKETFGVPVGFSDHSTSIAIPAAAVALGASVIEKHIKLEGLPCRDAPVSLTPVELKRLVKDVREVAASMGSSKKQLLASEKDRRVSVFGRRSILTGRSLGAGEIINERDLVFKRPGTGISVNELERVVGRKLNKSKGPEEKILWDDLE